MPRFSNCNSVLQYNWNSLLQIANLSTIYSDHLCSYKSHLISLINQSPAVLTNLAKTPPSTPTLIPKSPAERGRLPMPPSEITVCCYAVMLPWNSTHFRELPKSPRVAHFKCVVFPERGLLELWPQIWHVPHFTNCKDISQCDWNVS